MAEIKWAVLGTGVIANEMAAALAKGGRNIYAVGNRTYSKAVAFAEKYGIEKVYDDFEEMFTDPDVDAPQYAFAVYGESLTWRQACFGGEIDHIK